MLSLSIFLQHLLSLFGLKHYTAHFHSLFISSHSVWSYFASLFLSSRTISTFGRLFQTISHYCVFLFPASFCFLFLLPHNISISNFGYICHHTLPCYLLVSYSVASLILRLFSKQYFAPHSQSFLFCLSPSSHILFWAFLSAHIGVLFLYSGLAILYSTAALYFGKHISIMFLVLFLHYVILYRPAALFLHPLWDHSFFGYCTIMFLCSALLFLFGYAASVLFWLCAPIMFSIPAWCFLCCF